MKFGKNAQVGDPVCIVVTYGGFAYFLRLVRGQIERLTDTQVVAIGGRRFSRTTGREIGQYMRDTLEPLTPELIAREARDAAYEVAERVCYRAAKVLNNARADDAVRLAALLPDELKGGAE